MRRYLSLSKFVCILVLSTANLSAQDRILIQQAGGSRVPFSAHVDDYTGREILLRLKQETPVRRYPRSDVIEVITEYTPHHERARRLFNAGKIDEAKIEFAEAFKEEDRMWVRREILGAQTKCALWSGDYHSAISRFLPIVESDPETFHFNIVPLNWTDDEPTTKLRFDSREWTSPSSSPLLKLLGASWLLSVADGRSDAEITLKRLAREPDLRIQRLAQMQLWRMKLNGQELVEPTEIVRWERFVEGIPIELRGGSYFVIGQAWKQRREYEKAVLAFLWLPLIFDNDRWLCAHACFEAADSLETMGDRAQAANLYSEVVFRYGDTRWGPNAETAWKAIRQTVDRTKTPN